jgi:hypothetical protein
LPNIGRIASLEAATLRGTQVGVGQQVQLLMHFHFNRIFDDVQGMVGFTVKRGVIEGGFPH